MDDGPDPIPGISSSGYPFRGGTQVQVRLGLFTTVVLRLSLRVGVQYEFGACICTGNWWRRYSYLVIVKDGLFKSSKNQSYKY